MQVHQSALKVYSYFYQMLNIELRCIDTYKMCVMGKTRECHGYMVKVSAIQLFLNTYRLSGMAHYHLLGEGGQICALASKVKSYLSMYQRLGALIESSCLVLRADL